MKRGGAVKQLTEKLGEVFRLPGTDSVAEMALNGAAIDRPHPAQQIAARFGDGDNLTSAVIGILSPFPVIARAATCAAAHVMTSYMSMA